MPELKHSFTAGRMNKDLDERLVPNGEYRDALNVDISTSEESDIGSVQTTLGNFRTYQLFDYGNLSSLNDPNGIFPLFTGIDDNPTCVGSIPWDKENKIYYFVAAPFMDTSPFANPSNPNTNEIYADFIAEYDIHTDTTVPVLVDVFGIKAVWDSTQSVNTMLGTSDLTFLDVTGIEVGMLMYGVVSVGANEPYTVTSVDTATNTVSINANINPSWLNFFYFTQSKGRVLHFSGRIVGPHYVPPITGINVIDNMLFWTDGFTEPKKVNIARAKNGSTNFYTHTDYMYQGNNLGPIREEHITVIKKNPSTPPLLQMSSELRSGVIQSLTTQLTTTNITASTIVGDEIVIELNTPANFKENDILLLSNDGVVSIDNFQIKLRVISYGQNGYTCDVLFINPEIVYADPPIPFDVLLDEGDPLYELKFPRFAYRYKFQDGEYSAFSPFSEIAFLPGEFNYNSDKIYEGYNVGMTNTLRSLSIQNWRPTNIPDGVIEVDILYKESNSPNVYTAKTFKRGDNEWNANGTGSNKGSWVVEDEMIDAAIPSNQLLRPWDNVPRRALAQEVSGNRLIYANYLQNYDLKNYRNEFISPRFKTSLTSDAISIGSDGVRSIKSLRKYQLGIVYRDEYGRETPVLTHDTASIKTEKVTAPLENKIKIKVDSYPPTWADSYKFFVKETSNEYYNLALDRYYDAEDGNIWLSFPSEDRNKLDEETTLILKKKHNASDPVVSDEKYKIIAIENEAPDFIKTTYRSYGHMIDESSGGAFVAFDSSTTPTTGPVLTSVPAPFTKSFKIGNYRWALGSFQDARNLDTNNKYNAIHPSKPNLAVRIMKPDVSDPTHRTKWYDISTVTSTELDSGNVEITIDGLFRDTEWVCTNQTAPAASEPADNLVIELAEKVVENRAEFDGRFFVKILKDNAIQQNIVASGGAEPDYYIQKAVGVTYLNGLENGGLGTNLLPAIADAVGPPYNSDGTTTFVTDDHSPFWIGGSPWTTPDVGFYDTATNTNAPFTLNGTAGQIGTIEEKENYYNRHSDTWNDLMNAIGSNTDALNPALNTGTTSNYTGGATSGSISAPTSWFFFIDAEPTFTEGYSYYPIGASSIIHRGTYPPENHCGVGAEPGSRQMDISFVVSFDTGAGIYNGLMQPTDESGPFNSGNAVANEIMGFFKSGQKFKFANDTNNTIYTIQQVGEPGQWNGPKVYWNHVVGVPVFGQSDNEWGGLSYGQYVEDYSHGMRVRFRLNLDKEIGDDGTGQINGYVPTYNSQTRATLAGGSVTNPTAGGDYTIWDETIGDGPNFIQIHFLGSAGELDQRPDMSENPAIFETEPKEDIGLDIYHEMGQAYPVIMDEGSAEQYIKVGDLCTAPDLLEPDPVNYPGLGPFNYQPSIVAEVRGGAGPNWDGIPSTIIIFENDTSSFQSPWQNGLISTLAQPVDNVLTFTNEDGSSTKALILNDRALGQGYIDPSTNDWYSGLPPLGARNAIAIISETHNPAYISEKILSWYNCYSFGNGVESDRIRDLFNNVTIDNGPRASTTLAEVYQEEQRASGLIFSGIYNSKSGVNRLNQFIMAEPITKDLNPTYGSIQKLFQRRINLIAFCEDRVFKILSHKDALFNADGSSQLVSTNRVLGEAQPFIGDYGISKNPESFATETYRAYFTDRTRGAVLRLSMDGLTPISKAGMEDFFRDEFKDVEDLDPSGWNPNADKARIFGSYDTRKGLYNITIKNSLHGYSLLANPVPHSIYSPKTVSYSEKNKGWSSFKSFIAESGVSLNNNYFTFNRGEMWKHHVDTVSRNSYYGVQYDSSIKVLFNDSPGVVKHFYTINYEGSQARIDQNLQDDEYFNLSSKAGWYVDQITTDLQTSDNIRFKNKEGKWFANIKGDLTFFDNSPIATNLDTHEFSVQGIDFASEVILNGVVWGCTDSTALNYDSTATLDDGSCEYCVYGCMDSTASNYDPNATCDDGSCVPCVYGCTDPTATNYNPNATCEDYTCEYPIYGCTDPTASNYNPLATIDDGSCLEDPRLPSKWICGGTIPSVYCNEILPSDPQYPNYGPNNSFTTEALCIAGCQIFGCTDPLALNYYAGATVDDGTCCYVGGCTDPAASNYNVEACIDDGSCIY